MKTSAEIFETLYTTYPSLLPCRSDIKRAFGALLACAEKNSTVLICGNGGSAADSEHIVGELMKGFNLKRPLSTEIKDAFSSVPGGAEIAEKLQSPLRAISLVSQTGLITAFANDVAADLIFAQQVLALSTSGNSKNVVNAVLTSKATGIVSVAITGEKESRLSELADITIMLPANTPFEVQELTLPVYHALCAAVEAELFSE